MQDDDRKITNGCGPAWLGGWVPDGPDRQWLCPCNTHDTDYYKGGSELDRWRADWRLLTSCLKRLRFVAWYKRPFGVIWALYYYIMVLLFGWMQFNYRRGVS